MEELLDLQLFAGEGAAGGGAGEACHPERSEGSHGDPGDLEVGGGIPSVTSVPLRNGEGRSPRGENSEPDRNRAVKVRDENKAVSSASAGGPAAPDGGVSDTDRNRAAKVRDENKAVSSALAGGPAAALKKHFQRLEAEAEQLREVFPGFDLRRELRDSRFAALTAPGMGVSVEDAYYALHRRELQAASMQVAARSAARKIASSIQSAARRPVENGAASPAPAGIGPQNLSREQREQLRQRIRTAAAMGEKIYP